MPQPPKEPAAISGVTDQDGMTNLITACGTVLQALSQQEMALNRMEMTPDLVFIRACYVVAAKMVSDTRNAAAAQLEQSRLLLPKPEIVTPRLRVVKNR